MAGAASHRTWSLWQDPKLACNFVESVNANSNTWVYPAEISATLSFLLHSELFRIFHHQTKVHIKESPLECNNTIGKGPLFGNIKRVVLGYFRGNCKLFGKQVRVLPVNIFNRFWKSLLIFLTFSENIQGTPLRKYKEGGLMIFSLKLQNFKSVKKYPKGVPL